MRPTSTSSSSSSSSNGRSCLYPWYAYLCRSECNLYQYTKTVTSHFDRRLGYHTALIATIYHRSYGECTAAYIAGEMFRCGGGDGDGNRNRWQPFWFNLVLAFAFCFLPQSLLLRLRCNHSYQTTIIRWRRQRANNNSCDSSHFPAPVSFSSFVFHLQLSDSVIVPSLLLLRCCVFCVKEGYRMCNKPLSCVAGSCELFLHEKKKSRSKTHPNDVHFFSRQPKRFSSRFRIEPTRNWVLVRR